MTKPKAIYQGWEQANDKDKNSMVKDKDNQAEDKKDRDNITKDSLA